MRLIYSIEGGRITILQLFWNGLIIKNMKEDLIIKNIDYEIDEVYNLYGITDEEKKIE